jgi:hypothetical protein
VHVLELGHLLPPLPRLRGRRSLTSLRTHTHHPLRGAAGPDGDRRAPLVAVDGEREGAGVVVGVLLRRPGPATPARRVRDDVVVPRAGRQAAGVPSRGRPGAPHVGNRRRRGVQEARRGHDHCFRCCLFLRRRCHHLHGRRRHLQGGHTQPWLVQYLRTCLASVCSFNLAGQIKLKRNSNT